MKYNVRFIWDDGDTSVGIMPGWGEGTGASVDLGPYRVVWVFHVDEDKHVGDWVVEDVQLLYVYGEGDGDWHFIAGGQETHATKVVHGPHADDVGIRYDYVGPQVWYTPENERWLSQRDAVLGDYPEACAAVAQAWHFALLERTDA